MQSKRGIPTDSGFDRSWLLRHPAAVRQVRALKKAPPLRAGGASYRETVRELSEVKPPDRFAIAQRLAGVTPGSIEHLTESSGVRARHKKNPASSTQRGQFWRSSRCRVTNRQRHRGAARGRCHCGYAELFDPAAGGAARKRCPAGTRANPAGQLDAFAAAQHERGSPNDSGFVRSRLLGHARLFGWVQKKATVESQQGEFRSSTGTRIIGLLVASVTATPRHCSTQRVPCAAIVAPTRSDLLGAAAHR